jgi:hypothetical protein
LGSGQIGRSRDSAEQDEKVHEGSEESSFIAARHWGKILADHIASFPVYLKPDKVWKIQLRMPPGGPF